MKNYDLKLNIVVNFCFLKFPEPFPQNLKVVSILPEFN